VEAAYNDAVDSVRDRTKPKKAAAPKPTVKTRVETYDFYADPGHGWLRVPIKRLKELGIENEISHCSHRKGRYAYLEEGDYQPYRKPKDIPRYDEATEKAVKKKVPDAKPAPRGPPGKPRASDPVYNKDSGMYEVEVYDPKIDKTTKNQFNTTEKAEKYRRLINDNPGWPLKSFKERRGYKRGKPKYLIIAWNTKSRGSEAVRYEVYDRDKTERGNKNLVARGSIEYKTAPDKEKIIEDLINASPRGPSHEIEFTLTPYWSPALSKVDRIIPAGGLDERDGKWMVWFTGRIAPGIDPREGAGTRIFDSYEEALKFVQRGRGEYRQKDVDREGIWLSVPDPPKLPKELREFTGERRKFRVDPRPQYEGKWNSDKKQMEYMWVFRNQIGGETYTLDELKDQHQRGEWRRRDRAEAAKHSKTLTYVKGSKRKEWSRKAMPLAQAIAFNEHAVIDAKGDRVTIEGLDPKHVALIRLKIPNELGIPEGKYEAADANLSNLVTHRRHPKKLHWDNVDRILRVGNENQESWIRYEKVHQYRDRFSTPKIIYQTKAKVDLEALEKAAKQKGVTHLVIETSTEDTGKQWPYDREKALTWKATKTETRKLPPDEDCDWEREEDVEVTVSGTLGEIEKGYEDNVTATYDTNYLKEHLGALIKAGFKDATLEYSTDMPMKITAKRDDGSKAEFWLAPCIGV